jgi:aspartate dehydrogenase
MLNKAFYELLIILTTILLLLFVASPTVLDSVIFLGILTLLFFGFSTMVVRIGLVGFGHLGKYLHQEILKNDFFQLVWVWNRTYEELATLPEELRLQNLEEFPSKGIVDLIVEVAHPSIIEKYAEMFLDHANLFIGSPTCFANHELEERMKVLSKHPKQHGIYIPSGALWGAIDIQKLSRAGNLKGLIITMKKHPNSLKLNGELVEKLEEIKKEDKDGEIVLYDGPVRNLCPLAPNNVNTIAAAAIAATDSLGFDGVVGRLISDKSLNAHVIDIEVIGPTMGGDDKFRVFTQRYNPAAVGAVTGNATYGSFYSSLLFAHSKGAGLHFC